MVYVSIMLNYMKKKKSLDILKSKTTKRLFRLLALIIFIIAFFLIPSLSIVGLVLFYTIF